MSLAPDPLADSPVAHPVDAARVRATWEELAVARGALDHRLAADLLPALVGAMRRLTAPAGPYRQRLIDGLGQSTG